MIHVKLTMGYDSPVVDLSMIKDSAHSAVPLERSQQAIFCENRLRMGGPRCACNFNYPLTRFEGNQSMGNTPIS